MPNTIQPNEVKTPDALRELWQTDEILWFRDGRWGLAGYAIPNGQGKTWTNNGLIFELHNMIGATMFELMHSEDVKLNQPPNKMWWWEWQKALLMLRQQIRNYRVDPGTTRGINAKHVVGTKQTFKVYPVPFFGERVRQRDIWRQCDLTLKLLGEIMQHSANEMADEATGPFVDMVESYITEMFLRAATKFFNYKRVDVVGNPEFSIEPARFGSDSYRPQDFIPSVEMSTERPPMVWWPTENDLSAIRGIQYTDALHFAERYPVSHLEGEGDWETTLPGLVNRVGSGIPGGVPTASPATTQPGGLPPA